MARRVILGRAIVAGMAAATVLLAADEVRAATIVDPTSGFHIALEPVDADTHVCIAVPAGMDAPADCKGADVPAIRAAMAKADPPGFGAAVVWRGTMKIVVTMLAYNRVATDADIADFVNGSERKLREKYAPDATLHGDATGSKYDLYRVGDARVARFTSSNLKSPYVGYYIVGPRASISLSFASDPDHLADARALGDRSVGASTFSSPSAPAKPIEPPSSEGRTTLWTGLLFAAALSVVAIFVWRYRRRTSRSVGEGRGG